MDVYFIGVTGETSISFGYSLFKSPDTVHFENKTSLSIKGY
jgi:hypothetical protein